MGLELRIRPVRLIKIAAPVVLSLLLLLSASVAFAETITTTTTSTTTSTSSNTTNIPITVTATTEATTTPAISEPTTAPPIIEPTTTSPTTATPTTEPTTAPTITEPVTTQVRTGTDTGLPEFMIIEELEVPRGPFSDQKGTYLTGYPSGEFKPDAPITCAEAITMLVRAYQLPIEAPGTLLTPTKVNHWAMTCLTYLPDLTWLKQVNKPIKQSTFYVFLNHIAALKANNPTDLLAAPTTPEAIKPAGSTSDSANRFITRASAVRAINLALNFKPITDQLNLKTIVQFSDLSSNHPYYADIIGVTVAKR